MKQNISVYTKFIIIISLFSQLNGMEERNNKRKLFDSKNSDEVIDNSCNTVDKKSKTEDNEIFQLLDLPFEMQRLVLFHNIENVINSSNDIFSAINNALKCIFDMLLTYRDFYNLRSDLLKHALLCIKDRFTQETDNKLNILISLLSKKDGLEEVYISRAIIRHIDYSFPYKYPSKTLLDTILIKDYKKALMVLKFCNTVNSMININCNNNTVTDNMKDPLIDYPKIKNIIDQALNNNTDNLSKYLKKLMLYLKDPYDINYINTTQGVPLLVEAIMQDNIDAVKILLESNIDINAIYKHLIYPTALHSAVVKNNIHILQYLLQRGADPDVQDIYNNTPLMIAAVTCSKKIIIQKLLEKTKNINIQNGQQDTALMLAAMKGNADIVKLFIEHGSNIDLQNNRGVTALMLACEFGCIETVQLLIKSGADVNIKNNRGVTALMVASYNGHKEIVNLLINNGSNVNSQDIQGRTALMAVVQKGYKEILQLLIDAGANVNLQNEQGTTAFMLAVKYRNIEILKSIMRTNIDINIKDNYGYTAFMLASMLEYVDIAHLLIAVGADSNSENIIQGKNEA